MGTDFRREAVKGCVLVATIAFVVTLRDRVVEILLVASFVVGLASNFIAVTTRQGRRPE